MGEQQHQSSGLSGTISALAVMITVQRVLAV